MPITSDHAIAEVLRTVKTIALLGASPRPERPSHRVMQFLLSQNFEVIPVNPGLSGTRLQGQLVYGSLSDIPHPIDMVDVFRNASYLPAIVDETIRLGIDTLWTQLDVIDEKAALHAEQHGVQVIMDRCPAIEWPRLMQDWLL